MDESLFKDGNSVYGARPARKDNRLYHTGNDLYGNYSTEHGVDPQRRFRTAARPFKDNSKRLYYKQSKHESTIGEGMIVAFIWFAIIGYLIMYVIIPMIRAYPIASTTVILAIIGMVYFVYVGVRKVLYAVGRGVKDVIHEIKNDSNNANNPINADFIEIKQHPTNQDAIDVLIRFGYNKQTAKDKVQAIMRSYPNLSTQDIIKRVLQL